MTIIDTEGKKRVPFPTRLMGESLNDGKILKAYVKIPLTVSPLLKE